MPEADRVVDIEIPVRNVWLLQLYASTLFRSEGAGLIAAEDNPDELPDLVARILADAVTVRLHTGLSVGFRETARAVTRVRGRINVLTTERHQLFSRGRVSCSFDEVVTDTPANRLAKAALERAAVVVPSQPRYRSLALQMEAAGVRGPCPPIGTAPGMQRERLLGRDRKMIAAAELLLTLTIPTQEPGTKMLPLPFLGDHYLRSLFELAAYGFYRHHLTPHGWTVEHGKQLSWDISRESAGMAAILPGMKLDIRLHHPNSAAAGHRKIVIDTKFTSVTKPGQYGGQTLSNNYVYQIYAYLMSQDAQEIGTKTEGLMLHPVVDGSLDEEVVIQGHRIRFATVDLAAGPRTMADQFLGAVKEFIAP